MTNKKASKIILKTVSNKDILNKILEDEKVKSNKLIEIFTHRHQKIHQFISKKENHAYQKDNILYTSVLTKMEKYNKIYKRNLSTYLSKRTENKNFSKLYYLFKKRNKNKSNDKIIQISGNLIDKYYKKNYQFSKKFLSDPKLFKENGLLAHNKKEIKDYYERNYVKGGKNKTIMRDIIFMNELYEKIQEKKAKLQTEIQKDDPIVTNKVEYRRRSAVADLLDHYKDTIDFKRTRKQRALEAINIIRTKQKEIEDDQKYINTITQ